VPRLSDVCQITPHSRKRVCPLCHASRDYVTQLETLTSNGDSIHDARECAVAFLNGDSVNYACEYALAFLAGEGIGMTRLPQTFLSAICACLAGIGLPSKYP
jgi:hypothetical protein